MPKYTEAAMQKAMQHARREPDIPILRLAQLYGVDKTTLGRRVKGKQGTQADARRDDQLFSPGEENAIIDHCDMMGKLGFPISKSMLVRLAQDMLNQRPMDLSSLRHLIKGTASTATARDVQNAAKIHILGVHWFDRFMSRHPDFKMAFAQYQKRGRKAAADPEV